MAEVPLGTCMVMMAGLPGTGKSTISRRLAPELNGVVLDKDIVRAALFPPPWLEYSQRQDDFCVEVLLETAAYLVRTESPPVFIFLDGRPFAFRYQVNRVLNWAAESGCRLKVIYTVCSEETAKMRLAGAHIAKNRNFDVYLQAKARFEEIEYPKLVVNTDESLERCVEQCLVYLSGPQARVT